jgi:tripartite-type tricarboxylate transporter receptor subunit TctC
MRTPDWEGNMMRRCLAMPLALLLAILPIGAAEAQQYPSRAIKLVIPYPAGGVVDITGRLLAEHLQKELNGTIVVENKPGAGGTIGATFVARAEPDGYTLLLSGAATHAFAPALFKSLPYDPVADFAPITQVTDGPLALCVSSTSEIKDFASLVALLKAKGAATNYASNGYGTYPHLAMELLKQTAGFQSVHVSFRGGNEAVTALLAGQVDITFNHIPNVLSHIEQGTFRVLATSGSTRAQVLPKVPTVKEAGYDIVASAWFGLFAPAKTPPPIIDQVYQGVAKALQDTELRKRLIAQGDEPLAKGPDKFRELQLSEMKTWIPVIRAAKIDQK